MKTNFYAKIAANNLALQRRFYVPHILTGAGLMGAFYIIRTLAADTRLADMPGGEYLPTFMGMGTFIMALMAAILLLYTNSFLMKQRKREFGLYSVLGMEKRHVVRVLFFETLYSAAISIIGGLAFGILFYKICSLVICRLLNTDVILGFYFIDVRSILGAGAFFAVLYLITYAFNCIRIGRMNVVELLSSAHTGEKEPKVKWVLLVIGLVTLISGYVIALTTKSPLAALGKFFIAVILVIIGTYCLFVAGTIWVLKKLKKNKNYYYTKKHMPAVSGLLYRMRQNAVGLASIAVMGTGVIIMISTTFSLYAGIHTLLDEHYPQHWYIEARYDDKDGRKVSVDTDDIKAIVEAAAADENVAIESFESQHFLEVAYLLDGDELINDRSRNSLSDISLLMTLMIMTEDEYNTLSSAGLDLAENEIALSAYDAGGEKTIENLTCLHGAGQEWKVKEKLLYFPIKSRLNPATICLGLVVPDEEAFMAFYNDQLEAYGTNASAITNQLAVTFSDEAAAMEDGERMDEKLREDLINFMMAQPDVGDGACGWNSDSKWDTQHYVYGMYGSLLFLGVLLGLVFLFATALIIYYKQISEGYEDRTRFQIMQKIGMSSDDVRKTINSQVKLVFFLPLMVAGVHTAFAFPLLVKLLRVLLLSGTGVFAAYTVGTFAVFALIYTVIYALTTRVYYKIVY